MKLLYTFRLRDLIHKASMSLSDSDALDGIELFPYWKINHNYTTIGERCRYEEILYKVLQSHISQEDWTPDIATSLYAQVEKPGQGDTPDNPIPYNNNMELIKDKYYSQFDVIYICIRDSIVPVYNNLADLINIYVEVYSA